MVQHGVAAYAETHGQRLLDLRDRASDQHQVAARLYRAGPDDVELSALDHRVGGLDPDRDAAEVDQSQCRFDHAASVRLSQL